MKKIMFNDRLLLTDAVLDDKKTMTRRLVGNRMTKWDIEAYLKGYTEVAWKASPYKTGEVVAIAQPYKDIADSYYFEEQCAANEQSVKMMEWEPGWYNKMFAAAYYMPHQIRIEGIKVERLQNISDEDCLCEGVQEFDTQVGKCYVAGGVYVGKDARLKIAKGMINIAKSFKTPQEAFTLLIDKVCGKGTWESNPYVFAYSFKLIK